MRKGTEKAISLISKQRELFSRVKDDLINKDEQLEMYAEKLDAANELLRKIKIAIDSAGLSVHPFFKEISNKITSNLNQTDGKEFEQTFAKSKENSSHDTF